MPSTLRTLDTLLAFLFFLNIIGNLVHENFAAAVGWFMALLMLARHELMREQMAIEREIIRMKEPYNILAPPSR